MTARQGDLSLFRDPVAEVLLKSAIPARLAYNWLDGTPRGVPIWFHWDGKEIVLGSPPPAAAAVAPPLLVAPNGPFSHVQATWETYAHVYQPLAERFHLVWYDSR